MPKEMEAVCDQGVKDLVLKGAIKEITDDRRVLYFLFLLSLKRWGVSGPF
jgi:hypothetical protein